VFSYGRNTTSLLGAIFSVRYVSVQEKPMYAYTLFEVQRCSTMDVFADYIYSRWCKISVFIRVLGVQCVGAGEAHVFVRDMHSVFVRVCTVCRCKRTSRIRAQYVQCIGVREPHISVRSIYSVSVKYLRSLSAR